MTTSPNVLVHSAIYVTENYQSIVAISDDERVLKLSETLLFEQDEELEELVLFSKHLAERVKVEFTCAI